MLHSYFLYKCGHHTLSYDILMWWLQGFVIWKGITFFTFISTALEPYLQLLKSKSCKQIYYITI
jgi:hypothetical protein